MNWKIPAWWTLKAFENDTYTLTRVDGIQLASHKSRMMIWGWSFTKGGEHFLGEPRWDDGIVAEAAAEYPDPADFLAELDRYYPVES